MKHSKTNDTPNSPLWLTFVSRAPENDPWFRLMVENPLNGQLSTFSNVLIELDSNEKQTDPPPAPPPV
jgi:hypothetical protein